MIRDVHWFVVRACPSSEHPKYNTFQTAQLCLFVGDNDRVRVFAKARDEIARQGWLPIGSFRKDTLLAQRVFDEAPEPVKIAYTGAKAGQIFFKYELDQLPIATKGRLPFLRAPRIGETFIDQVVSAAGGRRLTESEIEGINGPNADYVLGDAVIELKDIQEEGLLVSTRRDKLVQLFRSTKANADYVSLSANDLSANEWMKYIDILGGPIQTQVKKAAQQVKQSRSYLGCKRSLVIFLNTGYSSIPHNLFDSMVRRYCGKDTKQIDATVCISSWLLTNGLSSEVHFSFAPSDEGCDVSTALGECFWHQIGVLMTEWAHKGFTQDCEMLSPVAPIAFSAGGIDFSTNPEILSNDLDEPREIKGQY